MRSLTDDDQRLVVEYLHEAEVSASKFSRLKMSRDELLSSAYYGLCKAALIRPRPEPFGRYASFCCKNQILKDYERLMSFRVGKSTVIACRFELLGCQDPASGLIE